jgi:hypothetical protein
LLPLCLDILLVLSKKRVPMVEGFDYGYSVCGGGLGKNERNGDYQE